MPIYFLALILVILNDSELKLGSLKFFCKFFRLFDSKNSNFPKKSLILENNFLILIFFIFLCSIFSYPSKLAILNLTKILFLIFIIKVKYRNSSYFILKIREGSIKNISVSLFENSSTFHDLNKSTFISLISP